MPRVRCPIRPALLLLVGLALAASANMSPAAAKVNLAAVPISRMDLHWWRHRFDEKQARLHQGHVSLIFLGDSITQQFEDDGPAAWQDYAPVWQQYFGKYDAVNLGFIGDTTANLLWREMHGELDGIHPKLAIVLIGANNLGYLHWGTAQTLEGIGADVNEIRKRLPQTKILLLGILPSIRSAWTSETTVAVNRALAQRYAQDPMVTFMDVNSLFLKNGKVDPTLFRDPHEKPPRPPLHPSPEGMARICAAIAPTVGRLTGGKN